ncbi:MAG: helix-turn-helix transcriptional regulator [Proteobacteria bacterium]|nr:helix-turn-helix transcriptional regulator [Pseudomonadota bacterium]
MEEAVKKHMGLKVKIMRERAKLTQEQLAEECGVSWRTISNLERGLVVPDLTMLRSIAQKFSASVDDMLELKSISNKSPARIAKELKLYEEIKALNSKTLDFLLDIIPLFRSYFK